MFSTYIVTAPRKVCYLSSSLESYFNYFDSKPIICAEPGSPLGLYTERCDVIEHKTTLGCFHNIFFTFGHYLEHSHEPWLMLCEDDIHFSSQAKVVLQELIDNPPGDIGYISLYTSQKNSHMQRECWAPAKMTKTMFMGNLCLMIPRRVVMQLYGYREICETYARQGRQIEPIEHPLFVDYAISLFVDRLRLKIYVYYPTLVLHLGQVSTWEPNNSPEVVKIEKFRRPAL